MFLSENTVLIENIAVRRGKAFFNSGKKKIIKKNKNMMYHPKTKRLKARWRLLLVVVND